jgi:hypothetical protein
MPGVGSHQTEAAGIRSARIDEGVGAVEDEARSTSLRPCGRTDFVLSPK